MQKFTQQEMLAEAIKTEFQNTQSLNRLKQLEEEKKLVDVSPAAPYTGGMIRYHSKLNMPKTYTFVPAAVTTLDSTTEEDVLDIFYHRSVVKNKGRHHRSPANHHHHRLFPGNHQHHHHSRVPKKVK